MSRRGHRPFRSLFWRSWLSLALLGLSVEVVSAHDTTGSKDSRQLQPSICKPRLRPAAPKGSTRWHQLPAKITPRQADAIILSNYGRFFKDKKSRGHRATKNMRILTDEDFAAEYIEGKLWQHHVVYDRPGDRAFCEKVKANSRSVKGWHNKFTGQSILAGNRANPTSAYHEALHMYCSVLWKKKVTYDLNEAATEWLTIQQATSMGLPPSGSYHQIVRAFDKLMHDSLLAALKRAYFTGTVGELATKIDHIHGTGSFDHLVRELDVIRATKRGSPR